MVVMTVMMLISFWIVRVMHFMCSQIKHSGHNQKTSHPDDAIRQRKRGIFFRSKIWRKKIRAENISSRRIYSWGEKDVDSWIILIKVINATSHRQGGRGRQPFGNPKLPICIKMSCMNQYIFVKWHDYIQDDLDIHTFTFNPVKSMQCFDIKPDSDPTGPTLTPSRLSGWVIEYLGTQKLHQRATSNSYLQTFHAQQHKSLQWLLNLCQIYKSDITAFQHRNRSVLWSPLLIVTNSALLATLTLSRWKGGSSNLWDLSPLLFMSCCYELLYVAEHVDLLFEARFRVRFHPHHPTNPTTPRAPTPAILPKDSMNIDHIHQGVEQQPSGL